MSRRTKKEDTNTALICGNAAGKQQNVWRWWRKIATWPQSVKKRRLSEQVMEVAQKEAAAVNALSETLPGTPVEMKQDAILHVSGDDQQKPAEGDNTDTGRTPPRTHAAGENQTVLLTPWILQQYQVNRPMDGLVPHEWIERKDAKFRCSAHSRVLPLLSGRAPRQSTFAPPIGIQMIEAFRKWQATPKVRFHTSHRHVGHSLNSTTVDHFGLGKTEQGETEIFTLHKVPHEKQEFQVTLINSTLTFRCWFYQRLLPLWGLWSCITKHIL